MHQAAQRRALALILSALALGCGPSVEEPEPPVELVERRVEPCRTECSIMLHPECGNTEHPNFPTFESVDACVDMCANVDSSWYWGPLSDGTDACEDEWTEYIECLEPLTCEQRSLRWNAPPTSDYPCKETSTRLVRCGSDNPAPQEGGS